MGKNTQTMKIPAKYTTPLAYHPKTGKPVFLMAGGVDDPANPVHPTDPPNGEQQAAPPQSGDDVFTKADLEAAIERAREQEKSKLYGKVESLNSKLTEFEQREAERIAAEEAARQAAEEKARLAEEEQMSAKELLARKEQEWQQRLQETEQTLTQRLAEVEQQRQQEQALLEQERKFNEVQAHKARLLDENRDNIAPQFLDFIGGSTIEEVERAVATAVAKSQEIVAEIQQAQTQFRAAQRGVSSNGYAPVGPMETGSATREYSPEEIRSMSPQQYAEFRQKIGIGGGGNNRGLFG